MAKSPILTALFGLLLAVVLLPDVTQSACLCPSGEKNGEFCGVQLNTLVVGNECSKKMYFCGPSNADKEAALLVDCPVDRLCDMKVMLVRNSCLTDVQCKCPKRAKAGTNFCGHELEGRDCSANLTFTCPYFSMIFKPIPMDACEFGCRRGQCLTEEAAASLTNVTTPDIETKSR